MENSYSKKLNTALADLRYNAVLAIFKMIKSMQGKTFNCSINKDDGTVSNVSIEYVKSDDPKFKMTVTESGCNCVIESYDIITLFNDFSADQIIEIANQIDESIN